MAYDGSPRPLLKREAGNGGIFGAKYSFDGRAFGDNQHSALGGLNPRLATIDSRFRTIVDALTLLQEKLQAKTVTLPNVSVGRSGLEGPGKN